MAAADSLREAFGLRCKESLLSNNIIERGGRLHLEVEGSKGGRPRELPVDNEANSRRAVGGGNLKKYREWHWPDNPHRHKSEEAYDAQRNEWRALGGTRKHGANMHGERHHHVRGMHAEGATNGEIMTDLGHGEERSSSAYILK